MDADNLQKLTANELRYKGHLDDLEDTVEELEKIVYDHSTGDSSLMSELVQLIINVR